MNKVDNSKPIKPRRLSVKQRRFINEYVKNGGNGTQAAIDAGYKLNEGDERHTASVVAADNMNKPAIREKIEQALISLDLTPEYILKGHKDLTESAFRKDSSGNRKVINPAYGMVAARSLENLGKISDIYPKERNSVDFDREGLHIRWDN